MSGSFWKRRRVEFVGPGGSVLKVFRVRGIRLGFLLSRNRETVRSDGSVREGVGERGVYVCI